MKPPVAAAALVAAVAGVAALTRRPPPSPRLEAARVAPSTGGAPRASRCPRGTLPDQGVCIPVPRAPRTSAHESEGAIPKRPDRPGDYARYTLPVAASGTPTVTGASDPADAGAPRLGISISGAPATPVVTLALDGQSGATHAVFAGTLARGTVVTMHTVRTGDRTKDYVVILENVDSPTDAAPRTELAAGAPLGKVGPSPISLEVRLLRPGVDPYAVPLERLRDDAETVPVDPRNVLPLR